MYAGMYKLDKNTELALSRLNPVNFLNKARMINANKHCLEMHGLIIPGGEYFKYIGDSPEYSTFFIYRKISRNTPCFSYGDVAAPGCECLTDS